MARNSRYLVKDKQSNLTAKDVKRLKKLITNLVNAVVADSWKGGGDPADIPFIEEEFKKSKRELQAFLKSLQETRNEGQSSSTSTS